MALALVCFERCFVDLIIRTQKHVAYLISRPDLKIPVPGRKQVLCPQRDHTGHHQGTRNVLSGRVEKGNLSKLPTSFVDVSEFTLTNLHLGFDMHKIGVVIILSLGWWMLCVHLTGLRDAQIARKHYFWVCWRDDFQKTLALESGNWIKQMALPSGGRLSAGPLRAWTEQPSLLSFHMEQWDPWFLGLQLQTPILPRLQPPHFLGLWTELFHWLSCLSSLQMAFLQSSHLPSLKEPIPIINLFSFIYIHIILVPILWRTLPSLKDH